MITRTTALVTQKLIILVGFLLLISFALQASTALADDKPIKVLFNENKLELAKDPIVTNGTTLVPFRPLFEAMGIKVEWNQAEQTVRATGDNYSLQMKVGSKQAVVNGKNLTLTVAPQTVDGHTLVPIRFISESTGSLVAWNPYGLEVIVYTEDYITASGSTKEQVQDLIDKELARIKSEAEGQDQTNTNTPITSVKVPAPPQGSGVYKPATSDSVDLSKLQGMYYGFRLDNGGYECGGLCTDLFTFLPGGKVVVGAPVNGGPETIDCTKDDCQTYTIKNGTLTLANKDTYSIKVENGELHIDDIAMTRVKAAANDLKLDGFYEYIGYEGLIGISAGSTSWTHTIELNKDGTFESSELMLGHVEGGLPTSGAAGGDSSGSYRITGNTLVLAYKDGTISNLLFFLHDDGSLQIGEDNYNPED